MFHKAWCNKQTGLERVEKNIEKINESYRIIAT